MKPRITYMTDKNTPSIHWKCSDGYVGTIGYGSTPAMAYFQHMMWKAGVEKQFNHIKGLHCCTTKLEILDVKGMSDEH